MDRRSFLKSMFAVAAVPTVLIPKKEVVEIHGWAGEIVDNRKDAADALERLTEYIKEQMLPDIVNQINEPNILVMSLGSYDAYKEFYINKAQRNISVELNYGG